MKTLAAFIAILALLGCDGDPSIERVLPPAKLSFLFAKNTGLEISYIGHRATGGAAALADVDGDGKTEVFIGAGPASDIFRFNGTRFVSTGQLFDWGTLLPSGAAFADLDNDGDQDLVVVGAGPPLLFANDGTGNFTAATTGSGLPETDYVRTGVTAGDYDGDGRLDLFIANWEVNVGGLMRYPSYLLHNLGGLHFEDVTEALGLSTLTYSWGGAWFDYDGDGDQDLYEINDTFTLPKRPDGKPDAVPDKLYENRGSQGFVDVAPQLGFDGRRGSMGFALGDLSSDGKPDVFITDVVNDHLFESNSAGFEET
ncbi:MAG TPA: VCBS repeat-containing protein, partial [Polyangiaceae bacterium]|nr:VCBS repeat-containing protein [Polyangiaceae bacterium]